MAAKLKEDAPGQGFQIVDAREKEAFDGAGDGQRSHIENSINLPFTDLLNEDGTFKSDADIAEIFKGRGISTEKEQNFMC